jgi:hypothetical protein
MMTLCSDATPCLYHPGAPFFHDAYKGWTCCNKKATDFTEFLNFPGCHRGKHSRVKPVEPENITGNLQKCPEDPRPAAALPAPREALSSLRRPPWESPLTRVKATVAASLRKELDVNPLGAAAAEDGAVGEIKLGESCKNAGCKEVSCCHAMQRIRFSLHIRP